MRSRAIAPRQARGAGPSVCSARDVSGPTRPTISNAGGDTSEADQFPAARRAYPSMAVRSAPWSIPDPGDLCGTKAASGRGEAARRNA